MARRGKFASDPFGGVPGTNLTGYKIGTASSASTAGTTHAAKPTPGAPHVDTSPKPTVAPAAGVLPVPVIPQVKVPDIHLTATRRRVP